MIVSMSQFLRLAIPVVGILCLVQATPIKENPTRPSILRPSEHFLPPSVPLYLPDPERNKSTDDYFLLSTYDDETSKSASDESRPTKLKLPLDVYIRPPPAALEDETLARQVEQAEDDKQSYSYNNRYDYYFPVRVMYDEGQKYNAKELQLMELQPPNEGTEPNYYATKPKKLPKKYRPGKKERPLPESDDGLVPIDNDGLVLDDQHEHEHDAFVTSQPVERFAPAPSFRQLTDDDLNTGEYIPKYKQAAPQGTVPSVFAAKPAAESTERRESGEFLSGDNSHSRIGMRPYDDGYVGVRASANAVADYDEADDEVAEEDDANGAGILNKRVEFQIHGFNGPNSYKFGYDTGHGKERLFRVEQREEDGSVSGQYGFVDAKGKLHMTKYSASKAEGFKAEQLPVQ